MLKKTMMSFALAAAMGAGLAGAATLEDVERSFYPYRDGAPTAPGLEVGITIDSANVARFREVLDPAIFDQVSKGWVEIVVGETTSFDLHPNYVEATRKGLGQVVLGDELGQIDGFVAGRPFPEEPSADDPRAGEKLAWNYKYGYNWGDNAAIYPFYWRYRDLESGKIERTLKFNFHFLNYKHRVNQEPIPEFPDNPSDLFRAIYVQVLEPFDVKNTQLLIHRASDDLKRDNTWLYLGFQRRVRRLSSGQITDSFLGADIMIEDFEGYNGRISDMNWSYQGTKNILLPFYNHNDMQLATDLEEKDGYQFVDFGGKGGCFPNITWQLRKVYVLEADPIDDNHPISRRVHYVDAQTFTLPRTLIYDRKGDLWKSWIIGQAHPDHHLPKNKGTGVAIDDAFSMLDVQASHCTTGQFKGQVDPSLNPVKLFTVQNMRATGR
ncbi:MAG: outer membrane lipoprotein-sorting protein [Halioglobus sp.]|nr:outer membrane lipoprotein-sorting protein [Halioglobus sp.]|tara:strand:- start:1934 stop:3244 length:1311 start_codon:yes stop_codon:yes gene_type:complete